MYNEDKFNSNGFIIKQINQERHKCWYFGVDSLYNWPIDEYEDKIPKSEVEFLDNYVWENIEEKSIYDGYLGVCSDIEFVNRYIKSCRLANYEIEILFCQSEKKYPICDIELNRNKYEFIGYDYAYPTSDYYSCIYQDVRRIPEMKQLNLNEYGLFDSEKEIMDFIELREHLKANNLYSFEQGEFIVYKLWRYVGNKFVL